MANAHVIEVTAANFQQEVAERSLQQPILVDFWADWCQPCRTLGPLLEKLADEFAGGFALAKINADQQPELAQAFQVQGLPFCVLIQGGRPVDAFTGALPEPELRSFLKEHGIQPAAPEEPEEPADPDAPESRYQGGLLAAQAGDPDAAEERLKGIPEEHEAAGNAARILDALTWFRADLGDAPPAAAHLRQGRERFLAGDLPGAMEELLESVAIDKGYQEGLARKAMLLCFLVVGEEDERLDPFRRRLATLMY